jgi:hypothetical protein
MHFVSKENSGHEPSFSIALSSTGTIIDHCFSLEDSACRDKSKLQLLETSVCILGIWCYMCTYRDIYDNRR